MRVEDLDKGWYFYRDAHSVDELDNAERIAVNLPHTWNNADGQDGGGDYWRGKCFYTKRFLLKPKEGYDYYIEFDGANSITEVYVNGRSVGIHEGGFSRFRFNITAVLTDGENIVQVSVDNAANGCVYPQMADFTFFGGIYRSVRMLEVTKTRFDLDYYGGDGVMVTPVLVGNKAEVTVNAYITGKTDDSIVRAEIYYKDEIIASGVSDMDGVVTFDIDSPVLWDGLQSPETYKARVILEVGGEIYDERIVTFGIRSFSVDRDGFRLNGRLYPLRGVSRHQDRLDKGWAISKADHDEDMALIREVGANSIRLAHYQHDSYFYDLCDKYGMIVWAEIPYISSHLADGDDNAKQQMTELIVQNYNHPSIVCWGLSNEITIAGESDALYKLHRELNDICHKLDGTRLTVMANVSMLETDSELIDLPDIMSYNHYFGWYVGEVEDNAKWLDEFRAKRPDMAIGLSEYGAEGIITWHSGRPEQGDYSEEYQAYYHENMLRIIEDRPYLWATYVWNMFDFAADNRDEGGVKGRNNKGLVTYDRTIRKDSFYLYKAHWSNEPFVHICSKRYARRPEEVTKVKVYSNQTEVALTANGKVIDSQRGKYIFEFEVPLRAVVPTKIVAVAGECRDECTIRRVNSMPKDYFFTGKEKDGIDNWFDDKGRKYEFRYPEDAYSIRDKLGDIMADPHGAELMNTVIEKVMSAMQGDGAPPVKISKGMIKMASGMTVERIAGMAGDRLPKEALYRLNEELNKIPKR